MPNTYLADLTFRLLAAVSRLTPERKEQLQRFFLSFETPEGAFLGKRGIDHSSVGDLYYSAFAIRGLFLLDALSHAKCFERNVRFYDLQQQSNLSAVEQVSLIFCNVLLSLTQGRELTENDRNQAKIELRRFRRPDGCFATSEKSAYSSTYQTFLTATAFEMLGLETEKQAIPVVPILSRQQSDGGFVELEKLHRSGTNPTAAAVGLLKIRGHEPNDAAACINFLLARQLSSGGFQANTQVPLPDLLSSFTAIIALDDLGAVNRCNLNGLRQFITSMRADDGGYFGAAWDRQSDVEYTFYGLALEALLAEFA